MTLMHFTTYSQTWHMLFNIHRNLLVEFIDLRLTNDMGHRLTHILNYVYIEHAFIARWCTGNSFALLIYCVLKELPL